MKKILLKILPLNFLFFIIQVNSFAQCTCTSGTTVGSASNIIITTGQIRCLTGTQTGTVTIDAGGTLCISTGASITGVLTNNGTFNLTGGSINNTANNNYGTLNITGGTCVGTMLIQNGSSLNITGATVAANLQFDKKWDNASTANATLNLSGTVTLSGNITSSGNAKANLNINTGATVTHSGTLSFKSTNGQGITFTNNGTYTNTNTAEVIISGTTFNNNTNASFSVAGNMRLEDNGVTCTTFNNGTFNVTNRLFVSSNSKITINNLHLINIKCFDGTGGNTEILNEGIITNSGTDAECIALGNTNYAFNKDQQVLDNKVTGTIRVPNGTGYLKGSTGTALKGKIYTKDLLMPSQTLGSLGSCLSIQVDNIFNFNSGNTYAGPVYVYDKTPTIYTSFVVDGVVATTWNNAATYAIGALVVQGGVLYQNKTGTNSIVTNTTNWTIPNTTSIASLDRFAGGTMVCVQCATCASDLVSTPGPDCNNGWNPSSVTYSGTDSPPSSCASLPLTIISFTGKHLLTENRLNWSAFYYDVEKIQIEKSTNGNSYYTIGSVNVPADRTTNKLDFEYIDSQLSNEKVVYYRLVSVNTNGSVSYGNAISVKQSDSVKEKENIFIAPSVSDGNDFEIRTNLNSFNWEIKNMTGEILKSGSSTSNNALILVNDFSNGMYFVNINSLDIEKTIKVIVAK